MEQYPERNCPGALSHEGHIAKVTTLYNTVKRRPRNYDSIERNEKTLQYYCTEIALVKQTQVRA